MSMGHTIDTFRIIVASFHRFRLGMNAAWFNRWFLSRSWVRFVAFDSAIEIGHTIDTFRIIVASFSHFMSFGRRNWLRFDDFATEPWERNGRATNRAGDRRPVCDQPSRWYQSLRLRNSVPLHLSPDSSARLLTVFVTAQASDLPTYRMPQVLDFMNAYQEFPERILIPCEGRGKASKVRLLQVPFSRSRACPSSSTIDGFRP